MSDDTTTEDTGSTESSGSAEPTELTATNGTTRPTPTIEPPEPAPGGPNAISSVGGAGAAADEGGPVPRDLDVRAGEPHVPDDVQDELEGSEDTDTRATKGEAEPRPDEEPPA